MAHQEHLLEEHDPGRKHFQIERIILFSDAVFAIAITLLIIEIKPPHVDSHSFKEQLFQLARLTPQFVGLIISFFVIAIYWRSHHSIFGFVTNYTNKLIWINNFFLFTIIVMPFSAAYFSEYHNYQLPYIFYNLNIAATGFMNYVFIRHVFNPANGLIKHQPTALFIKLFKARAIATPLFFVSTTLSVPFGYVPSPMIYIFIWPMLAILQRVITTNHSQKIAPAIVEETTPE